MNPPIRSARFYSLDALRGVAALCVVLWHWQHFFFVGTTPGAEVVSRLPLARVLFAAYTRGELAVDLFFCLSGFIFYWLYSERVSRKAISLGRFAQLRFSRLYPLHLATLLFVAVGQRWMMHAKDCYFVYAINDKLHFAYNLFFISGWGIERGFSFNGPIWSVSVEVFLYGLFFALCRFLPMRAVVLAGAALVGFVLQNTCEWAIGRGMFAFFVGGCCYLIYQKTSRSPNLRRCALAAGLVAAGAWIVTMAMIYAGGDAERHVAACLARHVQGLVDGGGVWRIVSRAWMILVLFPATILSLALAETWRGTLGRRVAFLGDVSYSSYLLHFPLQFAVATAVAHWNIDGSIYYSGWFMTAFFAVLLLLSLGSYRYFEMPAQNFIRRLGKTPGGK